MKKNNLTIFVEGDVDRIIVRNILISAGLGEHGVEICACNGKLGVEKTISLLKDSSTQKYIALIDSDEFSIADSIETASEQLNYPAIQVFCAIPTIESWLFSDDRLAMHTAKTTHAKSILSRAPLPELIPYPKYLATKVFNMKSASPYEFVKYIDIYRASTRTASLRAFISGVAKALEHTLELPLQSLSSSATRDVFSTLLRELPSETLAWRTLDSTAISADQLAKEIVEGTDIGKQYVTEVLRVARDLVSRRSRQ